MRSIDADAERLGEIRHLGVGCVVQRGRGGRIADGELGADLIKADPPDDAADLPKILEVAGAVPVLVRGGGKAGEAEILRRTHAVMRAGARGIVYGRNVIQHPNPTAMTRAFMAIVHDGATPEAALAILRGSHA